MFGLEPDLLCARCADRVRDVYRPGGSFRLRFHAPHVASLAVAVAALFFVLVHVVRDPPGWVWFWIATDGIWDGELWRLITTAFFHADAMHFLFNAWWCWELGKGIEDGWGHGTTLALYVVGAGFASALEWMVEGGGVGLSGVVYAMAGFLFALRHRHPVAAALMSPWRAKLLIAWFFACVILTMKGVWAVGNWAHGGGAVWGWLLGSAYPHRLRRPLVALVIALGVAAIALAPFVAFGPQAEARAEHVALRSVLGR